MPDASEVNRVKRGLITDLVYLRSVAHALRRLPYIELPSRRLSALMYDARALRPVRVSL